MSRRWPNTPTWQLVAGELRKVYGRSWRRFGEVVFGVEAGQLRRFVDREHTDAEAEYIERRLADMHRAEIARLTAAVADAKQAAQTYREERARRETERHRARFDANQDEVEQMIAEHYDWFIKNLQEEAA